MYTDVCVCVYVYVYVCIHNVCVYVFVCKYTHKHTHTSTHTHTSSSDELAVAVTRKEKAERDAFSLPHLMKELSSLGQQYQLTLELLGATEEELDDMRMTLEEIRLIYRGELERLLDALPTDQIKWDLPAFPTTVRATPKKPIPAGVGGAKDDVLAEG
jgi:hypothetical protein